MGETRTSVKDVIPEIGTAFNLDENVIKGQPYPLVRLNLQRLILRALKSFRKAPGLWKQLAMAQQRGLAPRVSRLSFQMVEPNRTF
jgi:hypothetical protein